MIETQVPGGYNPNGRKRDGFQFDWNPAGSGGDQNPGTRLVRAFIWVPCFFSCHPLRTFHNIFDIMKIDRKRGP